MMMKIKYIILSLFSLVLAISFTSCEEFLDKKDTSTEYMSEDDIVNDPIMFRTYANRLYDVTSWVFEGRSYQRGAEGWSGKNLTATMYGCGEALMARADYPMNSALALGLYQNLTGWIQYACDEFADCYAFSWEGINQANLILSVIDGACLESEEPLEDEMRAQIKAEALYTRAFCYFELIRRWGGVPYFEDRLYASTDMNVARKPYDEIVEEIIEDLDLATELFPEVSYNEEGDVDFGRYGKASSMGLKSRVLTTAASPQNNPGNDKKKWERAASAAWDIIKLGIDNPTKVGLYQGNYNDIFIDTKQTIEAIHPLYRSMTSASPFSSYTWHTSYHTWGHGASVTVELADKFETSDGYPIVTGYRGEKSDAGVDPIFYPGTIYDEQNPHVNRDPRYYKSLLHHGQEWVIRKEGQTLDFMHDPYTKTSGVDRAAYKASSQPYTNQTGYAIQKFMKSGWNYAISTYRTNAYSNAPYIRMAEMYLNYAEAVNEAYQDPSSKYSGATLSAIDAVNAVRNRVGHVDIPSEFLNYSDFQLRLRNEYAVELCLEYYQWYYLLRWKLSEEEIGGRHFTGVYIIPDDSQPTGYRYERFNKSAEYLVSPYVFEERNYLMPFNTTDMQINPNLEQNPGWATGR